MLDPGAAYFDHGTRSPSLRAVLVAEYRTRETQTRALSAGAPAPAAGDIRQLIARMAEFVGCNVDELALMRGAGEGLSLTAAALKLQPEDEIVTTAHEHPAALEPWLQKARRTGVVVRQVPLPSPISGAAEALGRLVSAVTPRTRVLAFPHVLYTDGTVMPVRELCQFARERGIVSVVDGAQALGMLNFQLRELGCDVYAANLHKWMTGSPGTGLLYVRPDLLSRLEPLEPHSVLDAQTQTASNGEALPAAHARLSAVLPHTWPAWNGSLAAVNFHAAVRRDRTEARIRELLLYARLRFTQVKDVEILTPNAPGTWGGLFSFRSSRIGANELVARLRGHRIATSAVHWEVGQSAVRASFHIFNTHDEIERLVSALQRAT